MSKDMLILVMLKMLYLLSIYVWLLTTGFYMLLPIYDSTNFLLCIDFLTITLSRLACEIWLMGFLICCSGRFRGFIGDAHTEVGWSYCHLCGCITSFGFLSHRCFVFLFRLCFAHELHSFHLWIKMTALMNFTYSFSYVNTLLSTIFH